MPSPRRFGGLLRRASHGVKNVFKPNDPMSTSRSPRPPPEVLLQDPPPQLTAPPTQSPASSQPPTTPHQAARSPNQPARSNLHTAASGDQSANAESSPTVAAKKAGQDTWAGLKLSLRLLEMSSNVFPPIKSAVAELLGVVDIFEKAAQSRKDYGELASNLQGMVEEFKEYPGEHTSSKMSEALMAMASGLEKEMKHIEEQQQRSGVRRHLDAGQDADDVQGCYRRVEALCRELQNKALLRMWRHQEEQQVDARLKELKATLQAMHDSNLADVVGRRTCTPGTRQAILTGIRNWADDPTGPKVYWLNGMAGTGKTTLAYSFCEEMQLEHRLGASFFCSRTDEDSRNVSKIVPTIAYQFARLSPAYREVLIRQMGQDKELGARRIEIQFEKLIRAPLREVEPDTLEGVVITIDALDECDRRDGARDFLNVLLNARDLPIKFFVTCRPEPGLFNVLQSTDDHYRSVLHLHDIEASFVQADIKTYLEVELAGTPLPLERLGMLAEQAGTLFIYAATAVRYIYPKNRDVDAHQRLEKLLSMTSETKAIEHKGIDKLYTAVLAAPFADEDLDTKEKANVRMVLDTAICAREPMSVTTMGELLGLDSERDVKLALQHLRSVINVSQGTELISILHASFPDFMLDRGRSKEFYCDPTEHNRLLALRCFNLMQRLLRFNICQLESSFVLDESIPDLASKADKAIWPELFYACRYWGSHIIVAQCPSEVHSALEDFLSNRLLFWMEVLNLKKCTGAGAQTLVHVHDWLQKSGAANNVLELALDAGRFVAVFGLSAASRSTPHIYLSALPFWPPKRPVRLRYWNRVQGLIRLEGKGIEGRDSSCLATWSTNRAVLCIAHSHSGSHVASGSLDGTIRVWDAHSGDLVAGPFKGHTKSVKCIAFSPDGTRIVSGSVDKTIRIWDAYSGDLIPVPFEDQILSVLSVVFSPDGTRIASGSSDKTIRVWNAHSGLLVAGPFEGHTGSVNSVAFSSDGSHIVSGSYDKTIRLWDAQSGVLIAGPFEGCTGSVNSVAFSPDNTRIVSGSDTICLWDANTGCLVAGPLKNHTGPINSVAFSSDSTRIVSGSRDKTILVWDAHSGGLIAGPFEGHAGQINSVVFSSNGSRIISGSSDRTIRVWDAHSVDVVAELYEGHTGSVNCVELSPDGSCIVSASDDKTIHLWDAHSGGLVAGPFKGHAFPVNSVAFSPDNTRIVSGSDTVCVWDVQSGDLIAGPLKNHTGSVNSVGFSADGTRIVSGSYDKTVCVWDAHNGDLVAGPFEGHTLPVNSVVFSPDGTRIVSGSVDGTICIWDAHSGDLITAPFEGHIFSVLSVVFSPDGTRIASGSYDDTIRIWDAHNGDLIAGPFEGHTDSVTSVAFSPDGTHIVSGSDDKTIRVWDAHSGILAAGPFRGHTDSVTCVTFSSDGSRIVSGSRDNSVRVWTTTPFHRNPGRFSDWFMDNMGMITDQQGQLLLCVPFDLWVRVLLPQNTICIYAKGVLKLDFDEVFLGNEWIKCYRS